MQDQQILALTLRLLEESVQHGTIYFTRDSFSDYPHGHVSKCVLDYAHGLQAVTDERTRLESRLVERADLIAQKDVKISQQEIIELAHEVAKRFVKEKLVEEEKS